MPMPRPPKPPARTHQTETGFWHWKPGERLRREGGFRTLALGQDIRAAFAAARIQNRKAEDWLKTAGPARPVRRSAAAPERPAGLTFGQIIGLYRASPAFTSLRASTRGTYGWCMSILEAEFASDRAALLTRARVLAWADPLRETAPQGLRHYAAMGRAIMNWARERDFVVFDRNPFDGMRIEAGRRAKRVLAEDLDYLVAAADAAGEHDLGTIMLVAFYSVQRLWDVLALADESTASGRLCLTQSKTGRSIDMRIPPEIGQRLEAHAMPAGRLNERVARDRFGRLLATCLAESRKEGRAGRERAARLSGLQLRDMRRSGFCWYAGKGIGVHLICSLSGHTIEEGMAIVETYLPKTPDQADLAIAMAAGENKR